MVSKKLNQADVLKWSLKGAIDALNKKLNEYKFQVFKQEREQKIRKITISAFNTKLNSTNDIKLKKLLKSEIETLQSTLAKSKYLISCSHKLVLNIKEEIKKQNLIADQLGIKLWKN